MQWACRARWGWGESGALPGWLVLGSVGSQSPWSSPVTHGAVTGRSGVVPEQCSPWHTACPVLHHHTGFPLGTETDPEWKHFVILYILEGLSFNNSVLNMVLFISIHDLWISNEHALRNRNLHGNSYKSGAKCTLKVQFEFLDQKLPSNINLYNSSKKITTMTDEFCFKLNSKAQALRWSHPIIFKVSVPDVVSLNPHFHI